ncbi:MAG: hypothetical protein EOO38_17215 [Cytophagaceae bacterium]|nr:MAG: hypothetical protein EOO38_17215 [Cytophagaceae bacterium]
MSTLTKTATSIAGAQLFKPLPATEGQIVVLPGENVQHAINKAAGTGKWVLLKAGLHKLPATLKLPSGITPYHTSNYSSHYCPILDCIKARPA